MIKYEYKVKDTFMNIEYKGDLLANNKEDAKQEIFDFYCMELGSDEEDIIILSMKEVA